MVTGLDLVAEQIAIAEGRPLRLAQRDVTPAGHAIECRINAEDWRDGFRPSPGTVTSAVFPAGPGTRVDTWVQAGSVVPPHYDSLLAKLIVSGPDRAGALARLRPALAACQITGVSTNLSLHTLLARQPEFLAGPVDTGYLTRLAGQHATTGQQAAGRAAAGRGPAAAGTARALPAAVGSTDPGAGGGPRPARPGQQAPSG